MILNSYNRLRDILSAFRIYDCEDTFIKGELLAYSAGIDYVDEELKTIERERFVCTAQDYGITDREKLFDSIERPSSIQDRRNMLLNGMSINRTDFNRAGVTRYIGKYPIKFAIVESASTNTLAINVERNGWITDNLHHFRNSIERFFPAHIQVDINVRGVMWQEIEEANLTFQEMDDKNLQWQTIDSYTPTEE